MAPKVVRSLVFCAVIATIAGCSSSSKSSSSASTTNSGSSAGSSASSTAHGTPILIGSIESSTGSEASSIGTAPAGLEAWVDSVNASGGIDGHPVQLTIKQDVDNPGTGLADAQQLIAHHVVAIVFDASSTDTAWAPVVHKAGLPIVGGDASPESIADPLFFQEQTTVTNLEYGQLYALKLGGATNVGMAYCAEVAQCAAGVPLAKAATPELGMKLVWSGAFSSSTPDLTPECLAAKAAGADGIQFGATTDEDIKFAEACAEQGWKPVYGAATTALTDQMLSVPALNNLYSVQGIAPWFDNSTPALQAFHAAMNKYEPGVNANSAALQAWISGKLFEAAIAASGSATVTSASVTSGLYNLHNETLGGLAPPLNFTPGKPGNVKCFFIVAIENGKYTEPQGLKTSCAP
jgi:branched-chain amino acid transport system substrate-binding protein